MMTMRFRATVLLLTASLAIGDPPDNRSNGKATGADMPIGASGLPKVEKDFSIIDHGGVFRVKQGKTFAAMLPPESIKRIILLHDPGFGADQKVRADPDRLFAELIKSQVRSTPWGLDALERPVGKCIILTRNGDVFKVTALGRAGSPTAGVTGVWLFGKGFSRRFDFRDSPLDCGTQK